MAADSEITVPLFDADGVKQFQLSGANGTGQIAPETLLRSGGVMVGPGNPLPVQPPPATGGASAAAEAFHILKTSPGLLFGVHGSASASGWFLLFDAVALPTNGPVAPRRAWYYTTGGPSLDRAFDTPLQMVAGAVLAFSTTGPFALTLAGTVAQFSWEID